MTYGYFGTMKAQPGRRDEVVDLLLGGVDALRSVGCHLYLVSVSEANPDMIWVTEAWESRDHHDASLRMPAVQAAIAEAMPKLTGEFTSEEVTVVGGLGV